MKNTHDEITELFVGHRDDAVNLENIIEKHGFKRVVQAIAMLATQIDYRDMAEQLRQVAKSTMIQKF